MFVFSIKFLLILYFVFTIDTLSLLVPGAMCGAGVIAANEYGSYLLILKLAILFFLILWFYLNAYDMRTKNHQWFKEKSWLFSQLLSHQIHILFVPQYRDDIVLMFHRDFSLSL